MMKENQAFVLDTFPYPSAGRAYVEAQELKEKERKRHGAKSKTRRRKRETDIEVYNVMGDGDGDSDPEDYEVHHVSVDPPAMPWATISNIFIVSALVFICFVILVGTFYVYSSSDTTHTLVLDANQVANVMATLLNASETFKRAIPPDFNATQVFGSIIPSNQEEWTNTTTKATRAGNDLLFLVSQIYTTGIVPAFTGLATATYNIMVSKGFGSILTTMEKVTPWVFDVLNTENARKFFSITLTMADRLEKVLTVERIEKSIDWLHSAEAHTLFLGASSFLGEGAIFLRKANTAIDGGFKLAQENKEFFKEVGEDSVKGYHLLKETVTLEKITHVSQLAKHVDWEDVWSRISKGGEKIIGVVGSVEHIVQDVKDVTLSMNKAAAGGDEHSVGDVAYMVADQLTAPMKDVMEEATVMMKQMKESGVVAKAANVFEKIDNGLTQEDMQALEQEMQQTLHEFREFLESINQEELVKDTSHIVGKMDRFSSIMEAFMLPKRNALAEEHLVAPTHDKPIPVFPTLIDNSKRQEDDRPMRSALSETYLSHPSSRK